MGVKMVSASPGLTLENDSRSWEKEVHRSVSLGSRYKERTWKCQWNWIDGIEEEWGFSVASECSAWRIPHQDYVVTPVPCLEPVEEVPALFRREVLTLPALFPVCLGFYRVWLDKSPETCPNHPSLLLSATSPASIIS